ncbi:P-loop containing nucleoside triphosphate hydrolase protein [Flagelloscypha sp. PMI_526]|nr:P-loop containing nucleoside triphosphate hydrolase protein [Flagelloscypha sp. PMI_526]
MYRRWGSTPKPIPKQKDGANLFNPANSKVKHTKLGIWDFYQQELDAVDAGGESDKPGRVRWRFVPKSVWAKFYQVQDGLPHVLKMLKEVTTIPSVWFLLTVYVVLQALSSLVPAVKLWFSGQMLRIVQVATEHRQVDQRLLLQVVLGHFVCDGVTHMLGILSEWVSVPLNRKINLHYSNQTIHVKARLDVPTFDDAAVRRQLQTLETRGNRSTVVYESLTLTVRLGGQLLRLVTEASILMRVLREQPDGPLLAALSFANSVAPWITSQFTRTDLMVTKTQIWAATTKNNDYILMKGIQSLINSQAHRKELVAAGNVLPFLIQEYERCVTALGENVQDFNQALRQSNATSYLRLFSWLWTGSLSHLPQVVFILRAVQYPSSIPVSVAGLELIRRTVSSFYNSAFSLLDKSGSIADKIDSVKTLHEAENIPNQVVDGTVPFPENEMDLRNGIELEFRDVCFCYPGSEQKVLDGVSFKIGKGELCVIVGSNGSGKSTILKLIARVYDPTSGQILINGQDLKTLRMEDVRKTMSVLFQDYTHFPLNIRDNIGIGDPEHAHDISRIEEAARLGGADTVLEKLQEGINTYLDPPVLDFYSQLPEGTTSVFGKEVKYDGVRHFAKMKKAKDGLSGGQMQRIAIARTFMRSLTSHPNEKVALLLFDEPSASLDPVAEYDLFQRLKKLRGNKSMIFSSHRFGNLTRHADLILYMDNSKVIESGRHDELLAKDGAYAHIWKISTEAFLG